MILSSLRRRLATRRRNKVVDGLLTSIYWQATTGLYDVRLERRAGETEEAHASRELVAANEHVRSALVVIGLFVRNELSARGILDQVEPDGSEAPRALREPSTATSTLKRTIPGRPE
jgi:hypothetical protein